MKIYYASDLHTEFGNHVDFDDIKDGDAYILAGDIHTQPNQWGDFLATFSRMTGKKPVVVVLGNHEYYGGSFPGNLDVYRNALEKRYLPNVHLLERQAFEWEGVQFLGTTLWSDFSKGTRMQEAKNFISDFKVIGNSTTGKILTPEDLRDEFSRNAAWLEEELSHPFSGTTVVVTHHGPSYLSVHPVYGRGPVNGAFVSDLEDLVATWKPNFWIHGHVHDSCDYELGTTRVLCNPWGYPGENPHMRFKALEF